MGLIPSICIVDDLLYNETMHAIIYTGKKAAS